jgi:hypothetical protein
MIPVTRTITPLGGSTTDGQPPNKHATQTAAVKQLIMTLVSIASHTPGLVPATETSFVVEPSAQPPGETTAAEQTVPAENAATVEPKTDGPGKGPNIVPFIMTMVLVLGAIFIAARNSKTRESVTE